MDSNHREDPTLAQLRAGKLQNTTRLKLACGLTQFPEEIFELADTLEILDLTGNALSTLPANLTQLKKLRILFCSANQFTHLPEVLGACENLSMIGFKANQIKHISETAIPSKHLRWFIVTDNQLTQLPEALGECSKLQKLMLAGNQLSALPESLVNCRALELLRISANRFQSLPSWLFDLPNLTWLAYAGNPFCEAIEQQALQAYTVKFIDWNRLTIQHILGEGASGITYQAVLHLPDQTTETVAVKVFKSGLTSDGLPGSEINANLLAGEHPNLVGIKGIINNHPQNSLGLVMPILEADLKILADPPSFESCTRDVYAKDLKLTREEVQHIIRGITDAVKHLHTRGLMHGDLYAHNILWRSDKVLPQKVVLSDLGGASLLPLNDQELRGNLLKLEARALEVLSQELLSRGVTIVEEPH